jgi:hypothetical protein
MKYVIALILLIAPLSPGAGDELLRYRVTKSREETYWEYVIKESSDGFVITSRINTWYLDAYFSQMKWENRDNKNTIVAERVGNSIYLEGRFRGKTLKKKYEINDSPWYQCVQFSLQTFALSGNTKMGFWVIKPDDLVIFEFEAERLGEEKISINGKMTDTIRIRIRPAGFAGSFWHGDYWFRQSDGRYIRNKAAQGPPGTPVTIVELVSESDT